MSPVKHLNITIFGLVQGVSFRFFTKINADRLGIVGFVQNRPDRTVYIEAEGQPEKLEEFLNCCRRGPPSSRVTKIITKKSEILGYKNFSVRS